MLMAIRVFVGLYLIAMACALPFIDTRATKYWVLAAVLLSASVIILMGVAS